MCVMYFAECNSVSVFLKGSFLSDGPASTYFVCSFAMVWFVREFSCGVVRK